MKPYQVLLFIAAVMACMAALCVALPERIVWGEEELRWPTLAEVFDAEPIQDGFDEEDYGWEVDTIGTLDTLNILAALDTISEPVQSTPIVPVPHVPVDSTTDSRIYLSAFYASLPQTGERVVRVMHYGDSQIEEDRITQQIRERLQQRYGGQGVGLMPLAQTIPSRSVKQELRMNGRVVNPYHGPQRYLSYASKQLQRADGRYGMMGQMVMMDNELASGSEELMTICVPQTQSAHYSRWRVFADSTIRYRFSGDTVWLNGRGAVYGLSQECEKGIIVDNIPMRGCLGLVFTKMDSALLKSFYRDENVKLIILQFGGNAIPFNEKPGTIQSIVRGLRGQVRYIRACAPQADILFVGPSDMARLTDGQWQTYSMVPYMDNMLRKMAQEEQIAYFSLYQWMGGSGSMMRWQEAGLACNDGVHFYRSGARKAGNAIADWILEGVNNE